MKYYRNPCFFLAALLILVLLSGCDKNRVGLEIGDTMPPITLADFNGKPLKLPDAYKGKILLLRFWSIDCHYCDKEVLLAFEPLYQKYKAQGFVPVAINESLLEKNDERFKKFSTLTYPMLNDDNNTAARRFGIVALPVTFVFDGEGVLRGKLTGEASLEEYEKLFTTVINKGAFYDSQS